MGHLLSNSTGLPSPAFWEANFPWFSSPEKHVLGAEKWASDAELPCPPGSWPRALRYQVWEAPWGGAGVPGFSMAVGITQLENLGASRPLQRFKAGTHLSVQTH